MPKFITTTAAAIGLAVIAAATATSANAQMWFPEPNATPIHDPGGVDRIGNLCWVNTETYREVDVHGYWRACQPTGFAIHPAALHHHHMNRVAP
jgi:hypothetical protein